MKWIFLLVSAAMLLTTSGCIFADRRDHDEYRERHHDFDHDDHHGPEHDDHDEHRY